MADLLVRRFFGKKRGAHNMRSDKLGGAWLGAFFALCFFAGCTALGLLIVRVTIPDWRANHEFRETMCRILDKRVEQTDGDAGPLYRPEFHIAYLVEGKEYHAHTFHITKVATSDRAASEAVLAQYNIGQQYSCWYDPLNPAQAVLVKQSSWFAWLVLVLPGSFIALGAGGLAYTIVHWGKSAERRSALAQQAARLDPFQEPNRLAAEFPNVPDPINVISSPGTTLAYRLPMAAMGWMLLGAVAVTLFWNGVVAVYVTIAVQKYLVGDLEWSFAAFLVPFVLVGIGLVAFTFRTLLITTGAGPTIMEIDQHPLHPGGRYQAFVAQGGRLLMNSFTVTLVCEEEARYHQGTNLRTAVERVFQQELYRRESFEIHQGEPFEAQFEFELPEGAMHSFKSDHNSVSWKLLVDGDVVRFPNYQRAFALSVYPNVRSRPEGRPRR